MTKYNEKLSQLAGLTTTFFSEINGDNELQKGEKFLIMQRFFADIVKVTKDFQKIEKEIKDFAKHNLGDQDKADYEGAEVIMQYRYSKPVYDTNLLVEALRPLVEQEGAEFIEDNYKITKEPSKVVKILEKIKK